MNTEDSKESNDGILTWIVTAIFALLSYPIGLISWAYIASCSYFWWMPYILSTYPHFSFTSFIALMQLMGMFVGISMSGIILDVETLKKGSGIFEITPKSIAIRTVMLVYIIPWILLVVSFIFFKIITHFISPVPIG